MTLTVPDAAVTGLDGTQAALHKEEDIRSDQIIGFAAIEKSEDALLRFQNLNTHLRY